MSVLRQNRKYNRVDARAWSATDAGGSKLPDNQIIVGEYTYPSRWPHLAGSIHRSAQLRPCQCEQSTTLPSKVQAWRHGGVSAVAYISKRMQSCTGGRAWPHSLSGGAIAIRTTRGSTTSVVVRPSPRVRRGTHQEIGSPAQRQSLHPHELRSKPSFVRYHFSSSLRAVMMFAA